MDLLELALLILCRLEVDEVVSLLLEMLEGVEEVAAAAGVLPCARTDSVLLAALTLLLERDVLA